jgi:hypothetical protein
VTGVLHRCAKRCCLVLQSSRFSRVLGVPGVGPTTPTWSEPDLRRPGLYEQLEVGTYDSDLRQRQLFEGGG